MLIVRAFLFVSSVILILAGFGDVRGQAPKDEKPKDGKEIAVAYMLGEPDRLLARLAEEKDEAAHIAKRDIRDASQVKKVILELEGKLQEIKDTGTAQIPDLRFDSIGVGKAGGFTYNVNRAAGTYVVSPGYPSATKTLQVIDNNQVLLEIKYGQVDSGGFYYHQMICLVKMPTKDCVDDQDVKVKGCFVVSGRQQYKTVIGGTKMVFALEKIDPEWLKAEVKKRMPPSTINRVADVPCKSESRP